MSSRVLALLACVAGCANGNVKVPHPDLAVAPSDMSIGAPTVLASATTLTNCLAVDDNFVYWSDQGSGAQILKVARAGGTPTVVAAGGDKPGCVVVDGSGVYYTDSGSVIKVPIGGGSAMPLVMSQHFLKGMITVAGGNVSWITDVYGNVDAYNGKNAIVSIATSGGAVQVIAAIVDGSPNGFAVDGTSFYWSDYNGTFALPIASPMSTPIAFGSMLHDPAFAVGSARLVQSESAAPGSGDVVLYRADGTMRTVLLSHPARPLAVDDKGAYVNDAGALERLALDGSGATLLATQAPRALALTTSTIYFTDGTAIYSLPR